jgi:hypothetical protein
VGLHNEQLWFWFTPFAEFDHADMSKLFEATKACGQTMASPISKSALPQLAHIKADILKSTIFGMIIQCTC